MRPLTILLIGGIVGLIVFVAYVFFSDEEPVVVDTATQFPTGQNGGQDIVEVPDQSNEPSTILAFERNFDDGMDPVVEEFVETHLNEYVYVVSQCQESEESILTLALNFTPNAAGLNTTEEGETYLEENFTTIAPYIMTILGNNQYDENDVTSFEYILFDYNTEVYRSVHAIDGESQELFHTWIGNSLYFSKSLECANDLIFDYYGSH